MSRVFVLDTNRHPLMPCSPRRARLLLRRGKASVFRLYPFTIILKPKVPIRTQLTIDFEPSPMPKIESYLRLKIDPGSKTTGLAIVNDDTGEVVFAAELQHRGQRIKTALADRHMNRRNRRWRKTRYRQRRFLNRRRQSGWLAPSLQSRVENVLTWVRRLQKVCPIVALSQELVRFDMQLMETPDITGEEYQRGTLYGTEIKEYLLEKWHRQCAYCKRTNVPLEIEHIRPKSRGGSNRIHNLTLACHQCNKKKGNQTASEFGHPRLEAQAKEPLSLKDAAAVNSTRWALYSSLDAFGLPVEVGTGGLTKWNRTQRDLPKTHWLDAACIGASTPKVLNVIGVTTLVIKAMGHGTRQICQTDAFGFPRAYRARRKYYFGMKTGDIVKAIIPKGKHVGTWIGRVVVKASGWFKLFIDQKRTSVNYKYCTRIWAADGYDYAVRSQHPQWLGQIVTEALSRPNGREKT